VNKDATGTERQKKQFWGIYYTDREYAREMGDPLRTVVEAPTKAAAENAALKLGLNNPWAHPVKAEDIEHARWLPLKSRVRETCVVNRKRSRGIQV